MDNTLKLRYAGVSLLAENRENKFPTLALPPEAQRLFNKYGIFGLGEGYIAGLWDSADLTTFMYDLFNSSDRCKGKTPWKPIAQRLFREFFNPQQKRFAFNIAKKHYDLGNDLFAAMLDGTMTYTCGYWAHSMTLDDAQVAKLDLVCRKLGIRSGMHILDIGCGWGNFAKYVSEKYRVKVTGYTVSKEQAEYARKECANLPVEIVLDDYRNIKGVYDHVVSIEMIEAVGKRNIPEFFKVIDRSLKDGGKALIQAISADSFSKTSEPALDQFTLWIMKHIFPDGYVPKIDELLKPAQGSFLVDDFHSFGQDYDPTLCAWARNFEKNWAAIEKHYDEKFKRKWTFYLKSCAALFRARKVDLFQILYSKRKSGKR